jgi:peptidoglycan/LPS O-acetylase OafA/YrhL
MSETRRVFGLDVLRAIAIGSVMIGHARLFFWECGPRGLIDAFDLGDVGVDLFFVLSGFLIGGILLRDLEADASPLGLLRFWSRRWWRTLPNYYLFLALNTVVCVGLHGYRDSLKPYPAFMQAMSGGHPFFGESWSLCVEEWFYFVFPAPAFAAAAVLRRGRGYLLAAVAVASASLAARAWMVLARDCPFATAQHATPLRLDSPMFGVVAAWLAARWPARWRAARRPAAAAGLALLAAGIALRVVLSEASVFARLAYFDVVALGVAALLPALSGWRVGTGKATTLVTSISIYSYSIYLVNVPLRTVLFDLLGRSERWEVAAPMAMAWLAATYGLSRLCYRAYESRMTRLRDVDLKAVLRRAGSATRSGVPTLGS